MLIRRAQLGQPLSSSLRAPARLRRGAVYRDRLGGRKVLRSRLPNGGVVASCVDVR